MGVNPQPPSSCNYRRDTPTPDGQSPPCGGILLFCKTRAEVSATSSSSSPLEVSQLSSRYPRGGSEFPLWGYSCFASLAVEIPPLQTGKARLAGGYSCFASARRGSNPQSPESESGALSIRPRAVCPRSPRNTA